MFNALYLRLKPTDPPDEENLLLPAVESAKVCSKQGRIEDFSQQRLQVFFVVGTARVTVSLHCSHSCKQMHGPTAFSICLVPQWSWDREGRRNGTRQGEQKKKKRLPRRPMKCWKRGPESHSCSQHQVQPLLVCTDFSKSAFYSVRNNHIAINKLQISAYKRQVRT